PDPTPNNTVETRFEPDGTGTLLTMRMTLPDSQTRAVMLATGMEGGMEASYIRLEKVISASHAPTEIASGFRERQRTCAPSFLALLRDRAGTSTYFSVS